MTHSIKGPKDAKKKWKYFISLSKAVLFVLQSKCVFKVYLKVVGCWSLGALLHGHLLDSPAQANQKNQQGGYVASGDFYPMTFKLEMWRWNKVITKYVNNNDSAYKIYKA